MSVVSLGLALNKCGYTNNCSTTCYCNKRFLWPEVVQRGQTWPRQTQPTVGNISQTCSWVWLQSGILISEPFADRFQADLSVQRGGWLWWKPPIVLWASFFANVWRGNHRENCCWKFVFGFFFLLCVRWLYERCYDSESVFNVPQRVQVNFVGIEEPKFEKCSHVTETLLGCLWKGKCWWVHSKLAEGQ